MLKVIVKNAKELAKAVKDKIDIIVIEGEFGKVSF